jgi:hypothetical protein
MRFIKSLECILISDSSLGLRQSTVTLSVKSHEISLVVSVLSSSVGTRDGDARVEAQMALSNHQSDDIANSLCLSTRELE